jgi:hypothetical protein
MYLAIQKTAFIGCRFGYARWDPAGPYFSRAGASGISVSDYQDVILVNTVGNRFYDETVGRSTGGGGGRGGGGAGGARGGGGGRGAGAGAGGRGAGAGGGAALGAAATEGGPQVAAVPAAAAAPAVRTDLGWRPFWDYFAAAMSSAIVEINGKKIRVGGPIWAIFDADGVAREEWDPRPPFVDVANGCFFSANTLAELATKLSGNKHQKHPMSPATLEATVAKYNSFVDAGNDPEFGKPAPRYKIQKPPFYAAWATPILHDCYSGLRVSGHWQVIDIFGKPIPGFYCAGESAAGITLHGVARGMVGGYVAATHAMSPAGATTTRT